MIPASEYWQPDHLSRQFCAEGHWALAKASLYNTPWSKTDHVISDNTGKVCVCANARLDNRQSLMEKLAIPVAQRKGFTDGHLILFAWLQWGENCAEYLLGDFVFVIWDRTQQKLFCARDHMGVKVLFYTFHGGAALISNEHNALLKTGVVNKAITEEWLVRGLWGLGPQSFASPWRDIHTLPAAHTMVIDAGGVKLRRYWQLQEREICDGRKEEDLLAELNQRFQTAVQRRLNSDYPLGAELSEGLDSCGIAGVAAQKLGSRVLHTFSYHCIEETEQTRPVWGETYRDIHDMLAMHDNLIPVWSPQVKDNGAQNVSRLKWLEQRFGGPLFHAGGNFLRPALANGKGIRTMLSGWGGDHCVTSYGDFYESELLSQLRVADIHRLFTLKHQRGRGAPPARAWISLLLKHGAPWLYARGVARRRGLGKALANWARKHYLKPEYRHQYQCDSSLRDFVDQYSCYSVKDRDWRELFSVGVENRLVESELCGRLYGVEFRFPMLDVELLEFAYNVPPELKIKQGIERYMFRQLLDGVTTERIRWRCKADVAHPNWDRFDQLHKEQALLFAGFDAEKSATVRQYCDKHKLDALIRQPDRGLRGSLNLLISIDEWLTAGAFIVPER